MTNNENQARLNALAARAGAGDVEAQYALGMAYSSQDRDQAEKWMSMAAEAGNPQAVYILGIWNVEGTLKNGEREKGYRLLTSASEAGFRPADYVRANLFARGEGVEKSWPSAISLIIKLAREEQGRALSQLAFLCLMVADPEAQKVAFALLRAAAEVGDPMAQYAHGKRLVGEENSSGEIGDGKAFIGLAANSGGNVIAAGDPLAKGFDMAKLTLVKSQVFQTIQWQKIAEILNTPPTPAPAPRRELAKAPRVAALPGFLSPEEADYMVALAAPHLKPSQVLFHSSQKIADFEERTSTEMRFLAATGDLVIHCYNLRISDATGKPFENQEAQGVLRYEGGQEYQPHTDYIHPGKDGKNPEVERCGQRIKTFLVYLNQGYQGGETEFTGIGLSFKGAKGDGLMFVNVTDKGEVDPRAEHAGRPVTGGVKWLSSIWIRERAYTPPPVGV